MALAAVSAETFWGDFALVLGSLLVLFSLATTGMTEEWTKRMTYLGAILLAVGAGLSAGPDFHAYGKEHLGQAAVAILVLGSVLVLVVRRLVTFQKGVSSKKDGAG
jgi:uncharacterized transporter YbjL